MDKNTKKTDRAIDNKPGVAINVADDQKVDAEMVKERTKALNNNPRNDH